MVNVENIDLRTRGVTLPSERVGVVVAQPFLSLTNSEPYVCTPQNIPNQLATIHQTLSIAKARPHKQEKTHFTIFPEYSIPGLAGVSAVDTALSAADWPTGTIVIGGITALTRDEYATLLAMPNTVVNVATNGIGQVKSNDWLNCAIVWVKDGAGVVEKWIQPKLYPAWAEQNVNYQSMFHGGSIFIFRGALQNGAHYRFSALICFDWIATVDSALLWRHVFQDLLVQSTAAQADFPLSWFFVIQHNPKPNHDTFLSQIPPFFDERTYPTVRRDRACVVFANSAGKDVPGKVKAYGFTSLVFSGTTNFSKAECSPTFASGGARFRDKSTILDPYHDVVFREGGACIISFVQVNPGAVAAGAANRMLAVDNAELFPIGTTHDPRVPGSAVPASVKWLNDVLDDLPNVTNIFSTAPLNENAELAHNEIVAALRTTDAKIIADALARATDSQVSNADTWDVKETVALSLMVNATEILAIGFAIQPMTAGTPLSTITISGHTICVLTVKGGTHQSCLKHSNANPPNTQHQCLLITKDQENTDWDPREESFLVGEKPYLGMEKNFTDPLNNTLHLSYQQLLSVYGKAKTVEELREAINARIV